ncbi:COA6 [Cervus elaphus hippelaphus]|uniref:COA6 n=1 Tax=Cervus elaphus hippelaphus TaxID=46360 RepID=A0A212CNR8_CEREH|nr:COA6 [Cervus elaphus hippelaphus]
MAAPSMKERQACWGARDEYWKCLDENTEDASKCKKLRSSFESSCPQQWMKNLRLEDHKKAVMEGEDEGIEEIIALGEVCVCKSSTV